ncbi:MAG: beta-mannosidase [Cyclobacteriaceae bacterium]
MRHLIFCLLFITLLDVAAQAVDPSATKKTKNLYRFLEQSAQLGMMFGHQDDAAYGIGWREIHGESDVKRLVGTYPAIFGWDLGEIDSTDNLDDVKFDLMRDRIKMIYKMGGINTISWHMRNPLNGASSWDKTETIKELLPGGSAHQAYIDKLEAFTSFIKKCNTLFTKVPIIFRPYHEHNGDWFWWGKGYCTEEEYIALWRFTVEYLRDEKGLHNLIYAFSPDRSRMDLSKGAASYLYAYPGDEYVDIIGFDNYWDVGLKWNKASRDQQQKELIESLKLVASVAREKNKVFALSETGNETLNIDDWYMQSLLDPIKASGTNPAWVLVWRNFDESHFYVPYEGQKNAPGFIEFEKDDYTFFLKDISNPYRKSPKKHAIE